MIQFVLDDDAYEVIAISVDICRAGSLLYELLAHFDSFMFLPFFLFPFGTQVSLTDIACKSIPADPQDPTLHPSFVFCWINLDEGTEYTTQHQIG